MPQTRQQRRAAARAGVAGRSFLGRPAFFVAVVAIAGLVAWVVWNRTTTRASRRDGAPSWSPDGKQIAFYSERNGRPADLFAIGVDEGNERQLTNTPAAEGYPSFSPDGRRIAFEADSPDGNFDIYVMNADGSGVTRLTTNPKRDVGPAWSPDGARIAFMSDRDRSDFDIFVMNADGGRVERLTSGQSNWFPQFSPDGKRLALHVMRDVHVLDLATRSLERLTTDPANGMYPSWSPDGARLAFMSWRNGRTEIFTMNADGSNQNVLVSMSDGSAIDPRWSPDGTRIAFVHTDAGSVNEEQHRSEIYVVEVATRALKRVTSASGLRER